MNAKELKSIQAGGVSAFLEQAGQGELLKAWSSAKLKGRDWLVPCAFLDGDTVVIKNVTISGNGPMAQKLIKEGVFCCGH